MTPTPVACEQHGAKDRVGSCREEFSMNQVHIEARPSGAALLNKPEHNKRIAFTVDERRLHGLEGLLPHTVNPGISRPLHPLHAILLSFSFPLFVGALVSDLAYSMSFQVQWVNFSSWLITGGLFIGAFAVLWALVNLFRSSMASKRRPIIYFVSLLAMWVLGLFNALVHAKDAWATMPESLYLSAVTAVLALVASWIGYFGFQVRKAT